MIEERLRNYVSLVWFGKDLHSSSVLMKSSFSR
jgi:hypothetical protein